MSDVPETSEEPVPDRAQPVVEDAVVDPDVAGGGAGADVARKIRAVLEHGRWEGRRGGLG